MAFYNEKGWYKSKTVWTGIIGAVFAVATLLGVPMPIDPESVTTAVLGIVSVLAIVFRWNADTKLVTSETTTIR